MRHLRAEPLPETVADRADRPGIVVDDAELTGAWTAIDLESLPFVPLSHARMASWRCHGTTGAGFGRTSVFEHSAQPAARPEPPRDAPMTRDDEALGTIPPDRIVNLRAGSTPSHGIGGESERARKWALAVRRRQRELDAAALNPAAHARGEGDAVPGASSAHG
jgi:hypothetical protein